MKRGLKRIVAVFAIGLLLGINIACSKASRAAYMPQDTVTNTPPDTTEIPVDTSVNHPDTLPPTDTMHLKYLALGDSYTIGQSVEVNERFPAQTVAALYKDSIKVGEPQYIATTGWTTVNLQNAIASQDPQGPFDIVTLLIGVNDQYQHKPISEYPDNFTKLLQKAIELAGNRKEHVFVLSIPDYSVTPFGHNNVNIRNEIDQYNAINKKITEDAGVAYINITDESRKAATDLALVANDGLHPSGKQYALWTALLEPVVKKALK